MSRIEEIRNNCQGWFSAYDYRLDAMEYLLARLAAVEALHFERARGRCMECDEHYPCSTVLAARGAS